MNKQIKNKLFKLRKKINTLLEFMGIEEPDFSRKPITELPECKLVHKNKKYPDFKYAKPPMGNRNKIGGKPDWIQGDDVPICPECKKPMVFYGQLDSLSDEFMIGDVGMIYVFLCFECGESESVVQFY